MCNLSCVYEMMHNDHLLIVVVTDIFAPGLFSAETLGCVPHSLDCLCCAPSLRVSPKHVQSSQQFAVTNTGPVPHSLDAVET